MIEVSSDPFEAVCLTDGDAVLAIIANTEGPAYRPVGAAIAVLSAERWVGAVSSGCVEADIARRSVDIASRKVPTLLRYGTGSPFFDIQLPCGGGLDILMVAQPDLEVLRELSRKRAERVPVTLEIDLSSGRMQLRNARLRTEMSAGKLLICFEPALRFVVFGKGPEASTFASLVTAAGYESVLLSPDPETLHSAHESGAETRLIRSKAVPEGLSIDYRTAVSLFFHDHDWEPEILRDLLETPAFYVGAQGSRRSASLRLAELESLGLPPDALSRVRGPIGLVPSARDPQTLAVSVLAEVLATAMSVGET